MSPSTARFFKQDIKIARQYNQSKVKEQTLDNVTNDHDMGREILREWVDANGLSAEQILSGETATSKVIQEHTLADIMADVQSDQVFQSVKRGSVSLAPSIPDVMVQFSSKVPTAYTCTRRRISSFQMNISSQSKQQQNSNNSTPKCSIDKSGILLVDLNHSRKQSLILRDKLKQSEHLPYSVWPKANRPTILVSPPSVEEPLPTSGTSNNMSQFIPDPSKYRRMSKSALHVYQEEMKKQTN